VGLLRDVVAGPRRMAHGRYRYEAVDPAKGLRKGTCHVLFAEGEIALLDPDSDFSPVESVDAISGISVERSLLAKKSTLRFDLNGMAIKLTDTVGSDEMGRQITTSLAQMFPGAMPLKHVKWFEPQVRIARDEFEKKVERISYAARGELSPRDLKQLAGGTTPERTGPIHYFGETEFDGMALATDKTCSFGFVRPSGEVVRWHWFDFETVCLIAWRKEPDSILVEIATTKPGIAMSGKTVISTQHLLVRFLDGPSGIIDYILDQTSEHSRFDREGCVGDEESVQGLRLLPKQ
jgi:hypothetical protein